MYKLLMIIMILGLSSCATYEQQRITTTGAMIGGATGALIGAESDKVVEGAVMGAAIGAVAGAIILDSQHREYRQVNQHKDAVIVPRHKHHYATKAYKKHVERQKWRAESHKYARQEHRNSNRYNEREDSEHEDD